ncbi:hypothetical protein T4B_10347 [Trichinella pseudospiralis]|uniref:Uncharacterized protein n=2 Tax=Trichinella pseudospiralis TaxID=6337 RepID=A0A0V1JJA9_TRIPS|nr:hypothetical protein T4D_11423 [Trichinella pseudospiralis]KRZ35028.1 hypothetical protein T4B_10347 [Trichinella pseudospiralis]KRZ44000.1 hypothetical protein T4C_4518 [Trichinella pseudospiralis]
MAEYGRRPEAVLVGNRASCALLWWSNIFFKKSNGRKVNSDGDGPPTVTKVSIYYNGGLSGNPYK